MSGPGERAETPAARLTDVPAPPRVTPDEEPPDTYAGREAEWVADHDHHTRDIRPALGTPGEPAGWRRAREGARVALARRGWADASWSYLYKHDTSYAEAEPAPGQVAAVNRRMRTGEAPGALGPMMKGPVWTWEVPLYFWFGGVAAGASFVALACDLAGDERSAATARQVAVAAVLPAPPLLIADLGRPERFLNMLRIFKPRSPMNLGAWCLAAFSALGAAAVGADLLGTQRVASVIGGVNAGLGAYLGSYTGVLLASTAVPVWARSRLFLGPIFVCTAVASGASATRLTLVARGLPVGHPTREALGTVETGAMLGELALASVNERRLGRAGRALDEGRPGRLFQGAKWAVRGGLALHLPRHRLGPVSHHVASACYMAGGLAFRYAWVEAGKASAADHEAVALMGRGNVTKDDELLGQAGGPPRGRLATRVRGAGGGAHPGRTPVAYAEIVRRASLIVERLVRGRRQR